MPAMSTYAIGDLQGCLTSFQQLCAQVPDATRFIFVGDLVNRGPESLAALRHVKELVEGGRAPNVIADKAEAHLLFRLVGDSASTREALQQAAGEDAELEFALETPFMELRTVEDVPTMVAAFTTDVPQLPAWGEPVLLGPGSIHVAHTPDEKLAKRELAEAIEVYVKVALGLVEG